jgi:hypothetical protein
MPSDASPKKPKRRRSQTRLVWSLVGGLALLGAAQYYLMGMTSGSSLAWIPGGAGIRTERFAALSGADRDILRTQRNVVDELSRRHVGSTLTVGGLEDLRILQRLIDLEVLKPDQTFELQALGVALGDVMAEQFGMKWVAVQDEYGRSRGLRLGETQVVLFPVTMISKRIELDVDFTVDELYRKSRRTIEQGRPAGR